MVPTAEAIALDLARVPPDLPWDWASGRLLAIVRGEQVPVIDAETLEDAGFEVPEMYITREMPPGVRVGFVVSCGVAALNVTPSMVESWGVSVDDVVMHAMAGLRRHVQMTPSTVDIDTSDPAWPPVRTNRPGTWWSASLVLLPDALMAIFGEHDQIFVAPYSCLLLSVPIDTDIDAVADLVDLYGWVNASALLVGLPAFVLRDGVLHAQRLPEWVPGEDDVYLDDIVVEEGHQLD